MADPLGYLANPREMAFGRKGSEEALSPARMELQAGRCIDCGTPFCEIQGCPAHNRIPDWVGMVSSGKWRTALDMLHATNNFPEITGRVCPAPCERSCVLSIGHRPVTVRQIELQIAEHGWEQGWIIPEAGVHRTGRRVAVIGSGPAGLAAAQQLVRSGHSVTVYERDDRVGGLLRYGIPDHVLEKRVLDRRIGQLTAEGVSFETRVDVGADLSIGYLKRSYDAAIVVTGARQTGDVSLPGRELKGIVPAMEFLGYLNREAAGDSLSGDTACSVAGRHVLIIGGGELGRNCLDVCLRRGAAGISLVELPSSGSARSEMAFSWPLADAPFDAPEAPEGYAVYHGESLESVRKLVGENGSVSGCVLNGVEGTGSETFLSAGMVILAVDSSRMEPGPLVRNLALETDERGAILADAEYRTSSPGVFAAGSCVSGNSTVARAIAEGRHVAAAVNRYLS